MAMARQGLTSGVTTNEGFLVPIGDDVGESRRREPDYSPGSRYRGRNRTAQSVTTKVRISSSCHFDGSISRTVWRKPFTLIGFAW
jgi:hypothetical protein